MRPFRGLKIRMPCLYAMFSDSIRVRQSFGLYFFVSILRDTILILQKYFCFRIEKETKCFVSLVKN